MVAAAEDPLGKLELWRGAKDPHQFLQACYGIREVRATGKTGVPIRLDQTTSGCGILAALTRQEEVGALCNLFGSESRDLYSVIAEAATRQLTEDLQLGDKSRQAMAELWLRGVDRGWSGARCTGSVWRQLRPVRWPGRCPGHIGYVPLEKYTLEICFLQIHGVDPVEGDEGRDRSGAGGEGLAQDSCRKVLGKGMAMEWTSPSGWPIRVVIEANDPQDLHQFVWQTGGHEHRRQPMDSPLSATQANKALAANAVASMLLSPRSSPTGAEQELPLVANRGCFGCRDAARLRLMLHEEFGAMHRVPLLSRCRKRSGQDRVKLKTPQFPLGSQETRGKSISVLLKGVFFLYGPYGSGAHNQYTKWQKS